MNSNEITNGIDYETKGNWLEHALDLDVYLGSDWPGVVALTDDLFKDIAKRQIIKDHARSRETLKLILLNVWIGSVVGVPIKYSRNRNNYDRSKRYGMLHFKYDRVISMVDALESMELIQQDRGFFDREKKLGRQTRMYPTDVLMKMFVDAIPERFDVVEKIPPEELIQLNDRFIQPEGKPKKRLIDYADTEETMAMRRALMEYNEFVQSQSVTVDIPAEAWVSVRFLHDLKQDLAKGAMSMDSLAIIGQGQQSVHQVSLAPSGSSNRVASSSITHPSTVSYSIQYPNSYLYLYDYLSTLSPLLYYSTYIYTYTIYTMTKMKWKRGGKRVEANKEFERVMLKEMGIAGLGLRLKYELLHRVFNRGSFDLGGRFYGGSHIGLEKEVRPYIHIDGNPTSELDYSGHHIRMLYHQEGIDFKDDPYGIVCESPEERKMFKLLQLVAINAESEKRAVKAIRDAFRRNGYFHALTNVFIGAMLERFYKAHKPIAGYLNSGIGLSLQRRDSRITEEIIMGLMKKGIAVLPIHDSYIVEEKHKGILGEAMTEAYEKEMGFAPVIDEKH